MPLINVKVIENVFSPEQKQQIVSRLTDAMVQVEGEAMRPVTWCVVEEVRSGDWAIGRQAADHGGRPGAGQDPAAEGGLNGFHPAPVRPIAPGDRGYFLLRVRPPAFGACLVSRGPR